MGSSKWRNSSSSDDDMPPLAGRVRKNRRTTDRKPKDPSVPWTEEDMELLIKLVKDRVEPATGSDASVCWGEVAGLMGNRNAKQCRMGLGLTVCLDITPADLSGGGPKKSRKGGVRLRRRDTPHSCTSTTPQAWPNWEKYRNDLRPEISKAPWSSEEDYVLALAHSQLGNRWSDIANYLPRRAENTIKNHWYATLRTKADARTKTFLWVYGSYAVHDASLTSLRLAKEKWRELVVESANMLPMLEAFEVPQDHFTHGQGAMQIAALQNAELASSCLGIGTIPVRSATARAQMSSGGGAPSGGVGGGGNGGGAARARTARNSQDSASIGMVNALLPGMAAYVGMGQLSMDGSHAMLPGLPGMPPVMLSGVMPPVAGGGSQGNRKVAAGPQRSQSAAGSVGGGAGQSMGVFGDARMPVMTSPTRSCVSGAAWPKIAMQPTQKTVSGGGHTRRHSTSGSHHQQGGVGFPMQPMRETVSGGGAKALGRASEPGDASCHVYQLHSEPGHIGGLLGMDMDIDAHHATVHSHLGLSAPHALAHGHMGMGNPGSKPPMAPHSSMGVNMAKHLPMALTFPGSLPGMGPGPNTPFALMDPDALHSHMGGHVGHGTIQTASSFQTATRQPSQQQDSTASHGVHGAMCIGMMPPITANRMGSTGGSTQQQLHIHVPSQMAHPLEHGWENHGMSDRDIFEADQDMMVPGVHSPPDRHCLEQMWAVCDNGDEAVTQSPLDEFIAEFVSDEAWMLPEADGCFTPTQPGGPPGMNLCLAALNPNNPIETAGSCGEQEGAPSHRAVSAGGLSQAGAEAPESSTPRPFTHHAEDCLVGGLSTGLWAPHSTARTGMRPAHMARFSNDGGPCHPLGALSARLADAGRETAAHGGMGDSGLQSPCAPPPLTDRTVPLSQGMAVVHGVAVVQLTQPSEPKGGLFDNLCMGQGHRASSMAGPIPMQLQLPPMQATPAPCGQQQDSLEQYYASRYPSIHTSSGRVPLACTFSSPSLATFPTPSGAPFGAPQPQQPSPNCQLLAPLGVPEQQQFLKTEQFVKLEDAGGWMDGLMSPQAQTQMEVCIHPSREIQKTLILQM